MTQLAGSEQVTNGSRPASVVPLPAGEALGGIRAELVKRARDLQPLLRGNARRADADRQVPRENVDALVESGVLKVWVPKRYGGHELDMTTQMEILAALAEGCASTAWVASMAISSTFSMACFPLEAQEEVWGDGPDTLFCGILNPGGLARKVPGGYRVTGEFPYASGNLHSRWAQLTVPLEFADGQLRHLGYCLVPRDELGVKDTWYTVGMRGTGSNTLIADDVFIPEHRILPMLGEDGTMGHRSQSPYADAERLYQVPFGALASLWVIGVPLGIARAALTYALEQVPRRSIAYSAYLEQRQSATTQTELANAATKIDMAFLLARRAAGDADRVANHGETIDLATRARIRQDCGYAANLAREAGDDIMKICGASTAADVNGLSLVFRDLSTASLHALLRPSLAAETYGRVLLGLDPLVSVV